MTQPNTDATVTDIGGHSTRANVFALCTSTLAARLSGETTHIGSGCADFVIAAVERLVQQADPMEIDVSVSWLQDGAELDEAIVGYLSVGHDGPRGAC